MSTLLPNFTAKKTILGLFRYLKILLNLSILYFTIDSHKNRLEKLLLKAENSFFNMSLKKSKKIKSCFTNFLRWKTKLVFSINQKTLSIFKTKTNQFLSTKCDDFFFM